METLRWLIHRIQKHSGEKGVILFIVAASLVVLIGFLGLAFDLGHLYNNKSQLQNMADACALSGASALNGTSAGIQLAADRARDSLGRLNNKTEFNNLTVSLAESDISFSTALNGSYVDKTTAQGNAANIRYVRVAVPPQQSQIYFAKIIPGIPTVLSVNAEAVAGQLPQTQVCSGLDPFSPAARDLNDCPPPYGTNSTNGNCGFVKGDFYELRLSPGNSGKTCGAGGGSVTGNFGLADPNDCGPSTPCFLDAVLNGSNNNCIGFGPTLPTTPGNRGNNVPSVLGTRYDQDTDTSLYTTYSQFMAQYHGNGRRIFRVPINDGNIPHGHSAPYTVAGFGCFLLADPQDVHPPSSAICMMYIGSCSQNGLPSGVGGTASITKLVLFR